LKGRDRKKKRHEPRKKKVTVTVSIGAAAVAGQKVKIDDAVKAADKALYRAKSSGRNCTAASEAFA
jgi:diguanylate cyclase (GGDEF)-like protein